MKTISGPSLKLTRPTRRGDARGVPYGHHTKQEVQHKKKTRNPPPPHPPSLLPIERVQRGVALVIDATLSDERLFDGAQRLEAHHWDLHRPQDTHLSTHASVLQPLKAARLCRPPRRRCCRPCGPATWAKDKGEAPKGGPRRRS